MFYKLGKKSFKLFINSVQFFRIFLVFLSFFTVLYWLFQLGGATWVSFFAPIFEPIKGLAHIFYTRTVSVDQVTVDFSFLVASLSMLLVTWVLKYVVEYIELVEKKYDSIHSAIKKKAENAFNTNLERQYKHEESQNKNFMILINALATNMAKNAHYNKDADVGVDEKQNEILSEFSQIISTKIRCKQKLIENNLLISFDSINEIDNTIDKIENIVKDLRLKAKEEKWNLDFVIAVEPYAKEEEFMTKALTLKKLLKLGLRNKIICLSTLQLRYSMIENPKYILEGLGIYKINDKEETVFSIKK